MSKMKLGNVSWSMMFKVNASRRYDQDYMWKVLKEWDKVKPEAFCEHAYSEDTDLGEETGDSWYDWHGFLSRSSLEKAIPLVFKAFPEVSEVEIYKEKIVGCYCNPERRGKVHR